MGSEELSSGAGAVWLSGSARFSPSSSYQLVSFFDQNPTACYQPNTVDSSMRAVTPRAAATAAVQHCCEEHVSSERLESSVQGFNMLRGCICPSWCDVQSAGGCVMHCFVAACAAAYSAAYAAACADAYCSPPVRRAAMLCSLLPLRGKSNEVPIEMGSAIDGVNQWRINREKGCERASKRCEIMSGVTSLRSCPGGPHLIHIRVPA